MSNEKKKAAKKAVKPVKAWAGVIDGAIPNWDGPNKRNGHPPTVPSFDIYKTRKQAQIMYRHVIRVEIKPI